MKALDNWKEEQRSAYLYNAIAHYEQDPKLKTLFYDLSLAAQKQADLWRQELVKIGHTIVDEYRPDCRARLIVWLLRYFTAKQLRFMLSALKVRGLSVYDIIITEQETVTNTSKFDHESPHLSLSAIGNLRAAVFGINDGLISNMCLLMGVVGGTNDAKIIFLTGVAGLLAGACSMAAGEYVSVSSQKDFFAHQIALEQEELSLYPAEEAEELKLIYQARGLPEIEAQELAQKIISNPNRALDTLAREELGLNKSDLGSPLSAALSSFLAFAIGALIPLLPFLCCGNSVRVLVGSISLTAGSLFFVGALLSLFTNQNIFLSGIKMLLIGASAGLCTYVIGNQVGLLL